MGSISTMSIDRAPPLKSLRNRNDCSDNVSRLADTLIVAALTAVLALVAISCGSSEPEVVEIIKEVPIEKVVIKEVPVQVVVEKEVIKEVPVEVVVEKEVIKEVPVEVVVEVIKEVPLEVIVEKEVVKEVPVLVEGEKVYAVVNAVKSISAGGFHTCALREGGEAVCWGENEDRQSTVPDGRFMAISAGGYHTCALRVNGEAVCWGRNRFGESDAPTGTYRAISAGDGFACALRDNNTVSCWGDPLFQIPDGYRGRGFFAISSGGDMVCALQGEGRIGFVICWGERFPEGFHWGRGGVEAEMISAGGEHAVLVKATGGMVYTGNNEEGQQSPGYVTPQGERVAKVSAGHMHTCAIVLDSGRVECWGQNHRGQASSPDGRFIDISAGRLHTCGVLETGEAVCWGYDSSGQATPRFPSTNG